MSSLLEELRGKHHLDDTAAWLGAGDAAERGEGSGE